MALRVVTAEDDAVSTAAFSGSALKSATPALCSGKSGVRGTDSPALGGGAHHGDSTGAESINILSDSALPHIMGLVLKPQVVLLKVMPACLGADGAVDGATRATFDTYIGVHPQRCPTCQNML